jgi:predicted nucleotidyltransferase
MLWSDFIGFVERKVKCARGFTELLASRLKGRLIKVVLFGSVAKGSCSVDSDMDLLIVVDRVNEDVKRIVAESTFEASLEFQEPLEYIVMELEEYKARGLDNPFIYEVNTTVKYSTTTQNLRKKLSGSY